MFTTQSTLQFPRAMGSQKPNENSIPHSGAFSNTNFSQAFYNHGRQEQQERQVQHEQPPKQSSLDARNYYIPPQQRSLSRTSLPENNTTPSYVSSPETYFNVTRPDRQNIQPPYSGSILKYPYPYPYPYPYSYSYPCSYPCPYAYACGNPVSPQNTGPSTPLHQGQNQQQFQPRQQYHYQSQCLPAPPQQFYSYFGYPSQYPKPLPEKSTIQSHYKPFQPLPAYLNEKIQRDSVYTQNNSSVKKPELFPNINSSFLLPQQQQLQSYPQKQVLPTPLIAQQQQYEQKNQKKQPRRKKQRRLSLSQPEKDGGKLDQKQMPISPKRSSIAGVVYNSSAVYKRLKLSSSIEKEETEKINKSGSSTKSQGRPFSSSINSRFLMHVGLCSLLSYADKKSNNQFVMYNYSKSEDDYALKNNGTDTDEIILQNGVLEDEENDEKERPKDADDSLNMEMILDGAMDKETNFKTSIKSLDRFLDFKNKGSLKVEGQKTLWNPTQNIICYSTSRNNKKESLEKKRNILDTPLKFLPNNDSQVIENDTTCDIKFNFHTLIVKHFNLEKYNFVKTIRDNSGHILKLESIMPPTNENGDIEYSAEWVKRRICYPRYTGGMNIHLLKTQEKFILYNDIKMLLWDIKEDILHDDDLELTKFCIKENKISEKTKNKLFGDKVVYVNLR